MILSSVAWFVLALHLPVILWAALLDDFAMFSMWANRYLRPRLPAFLKSGKEWTMIGVIMQRKVRRENGTCLTDGGLMVSWIPLVLS